MRAGSSPILGSRCSTLFVLICITRDGGLHAFSSILSRVTGPCADLRRTVTYAFTEVFGSIHDLSVLKSRSSFFGALSHVLTAFGVRAFDVLASLTKLCAR